MKKWLLLLCLLALAAALSACGCAHENTFVDGSVDATCTTDGFTGNLMCSDCNEMVTAGVVIPAYGHAETEALFAKEGTCTYPGYSGDTYCLRCLAVVKAGEELPKGDHVPEEDYSYEATCDSSGHITELHCADCGTLLREEADLEPLGHVVPHPEGACDPTCSAVGWTGSGECVVCGKSVSSYAIERIPHSYEGLQCAVCGYYKAGLYNDDMTEMIHTWDELVAMQVFNDDTEVDEINSVNGIEGVLVIEDDHDICLHSKYAFNGGYELNLSGIHVPASETRLSDNAFRGVKLDTLRIWGAVEELPYGFLCGADIENLILPDTLKTVGYGAFNANLAEEIVLPETVEVIGESSFWGCENLKSFTTPKSLRELHNYAFVRCPALEEVVLEGEAVFVGEGTFAENPMLSSVTISETFGSIGSGMFMSCPALTEIELPEGLTGIYDDAFAYTGITDLVLPSTIQTVGRLSDMGEVRSVDMGACELITEWNGMRSCRNLTEIILPPNIVVLGDIFSGNSALTRVVLPDSVEALAFNWVSGCGLQEIVWPVSLTDGSALSDADGLTSILYRGTEEQWNATASKDLFADAQVIFNYTGY